MNIFRRNVLLLILLLVFLLGARKLWVQFGTFGEGSYSTSPDGILKASAWSYSAPKFWSGDTRYWIQTSIKHLKTGKVLYEGNFHRSGNCRSGDVKWSVEPKSESASEISKRKQDSQLLGSQISPPMVHNVIFDCGTKLSIQAINSLHWVLTQAINNYRG